MTKILNELMNQPITLIINKITYVQRSHPNPEHRCKECHLREWCYDNQFMMACAIFNPNTVFLRADIVNSKP